MNIKEKQLTYLSNELPKLYKAVYSVRCDMDYVLEEWLHQKYEIEEKLSELKYLCHIRIQQEKLNKLAETLTVGEQITSKIYFDIEEPIEDMSDNILYCQGDFESINVEEIHSKLERILNSLYEIIVQTETIKSMKRGLASHTKRIKIIALDLEKHLEKLDVRVALIDDISDAVGAQTIQKDNIVVVIGRCPVCANFLEQYTSDCKQCGFSEARVELVEADNYAKWVVDIGVYREKLFKNLNFELVNGRLYCEDPKETEDCLALQLEEADKCVVVAYNELTKEYMWVPKKLLDIIPHRNIFSGNLIENFKSFQLHIGEGLTLGVEERTSKHNLKEFVIFASDSGDYEKTKKIDEDAFRYFASLLFDRVHEDWGIQDWEPKAFESSIIIPQYSMEQIDYISNYGAPTFDLKIDFYDFCSLKLSGMRTQKIHDFIRRMFFNMDELERIIMDNLLLFMSYVVPLDIVNTYDEVDF